MPTCSAGMVVFDEVGRVLLILREDVRIWALPGGKVEPGESFEDAAVREAREETGYEVVIERMVGEYRRPHHPEGGDVIRVYVGRVVGGGPEYRGWEAVAVQWFPLDRLPRRLSPLAREHIRDARANRDPVYKEQHVPLTWHLLGRAALWWRKRRRGK